MKHVDLLRGLYGCVSDAELAVQLDVSRPTISRFRKHGLPDSVRGQLICRLLREGREVPAGLLVPQHPAEVDMRVMPG